MSVEVKKLCAIDRQSCLEYLYRLICVDAVEFSYHACKIMDCEDNNTVATLMVTSYIRALGDAYGQILDINEEERDTITKLADYSYELLHKLVTGEVTEIPKEVPETIIKEDTNGTL